MGAGRSRSGATLPPWLFQIWASSPTLRSSISNEVKNNFGLHKVKGTKFENSIRPLHDYEGTLTPIPSVIVLIE